MSNLTLTQKTLLALVGHNLFDAPFSPDADTDWAAVLRESKMQSVPLVAFKNYKELPLDAETAENIQKSVKQYTMNNIGCFKDHAYLHRLMSEKNIPYCVVKGVASANYYPEPLLRAMGDVDFYVHPDDIDRAMAIFAEDGFERQDINHRIHIVLRKGRMHFEMHFAPVAVPEGKMGEVVKEYWQNIRESSSLTTTDFTTYRGPSAFHHGLIQLCHFQHHLLVEGIGLRHFCDWAVFANSFSNEEFVELFESKLKRVGLWRLAQLICLAAVEYVGMPRKEWMGDDFKTAEELMEDILSGGNFGRKDKQRAYEGFFISKHGADGVKTNRILQAVKSVNGIIDNYWKAAKKFPLLYPVGWVYFGGRYLFRLITGKRKLDFVDAYTKSGERKELYKKFNLFEPEE